MATVLDTSFHLTQGYVSCTTEMGLIRVYAVPYGQVVPQMAIFVRQSGPHATHRAYVFDGFAPALSTLGPTSGQIMYTNLHPTGGGTVLAQTSFPGGYPSVVGLAGGLGYYWHFYLYLPALPTTRVTLFQMASTSGTPTNMPTCELLPSGFLQVRSIEDGHTLMSSAPVAPHAKHWIVIQPNVGNAQAIVVDNVPSVILGDTFTFTGNGVTYSTSFLSNLDGTQLVPLGTWISKIGYGASFTGGAVVPLSIGTGDYPTGDSQIPNLNSGASLDTLNRYLCTDTPGSATLANSALATTGSNLTLTTAYANLLATGPY